MERYPLHHNEAAKRYEFDTEGGMCLLEYIQTGEGDLYLTHTEVPENLEGKGFGTALVKAVLEDVRGRGLKIVPLCPFVATYIRRHPEWKELLQEGFQL